MYCFTNADTGATTFDPYRFMLRRAYAEGTDLRLYVTPLNASVRKLMSRSVSANTTSSGSRSSFASMRRKRHARRANRCRCGISAMSTPLRGEPFPLPTDPNPMRWFWDYSHYRKAAGDLILDRILDHGEAGRNLPADFGVRLTGENVDAHVARNEARLADWTAANTELASQIVAATRSPKGTEPPSRGCLLVGHAVQFPDCSCFCSCRSRWRASSCWRGCSAATQRWASCCSLAWCSTPIPACSILRCSSFPCIANFLLGYAIAHFRQSSRVWLIGGIVLNLGLIGYFKYAGFLVSGLNDIFSVAFVVPHIVLPVGISFYTFEQISYLVESRQSGRAEPSLLRYALFVSFFPHLIAGPIIRPHQLLPQFSNPAFGRFDWQNFAIGTTFLLFGLFKKVILADGIAIYATPVFAAAATAERPASSTPGARPRLHVPDLFRLLRLFRHGDRARPDVRHRAAVQFQFALQGHQHHRLLASLAHDAVAVPARLCVHSARRQPRRRRCAATSTSCSRC